MDLRGRAGKEERGEGDNETERVIDFEELAPRFMEPGKLLGQLLAENGVRVDATFLSREAHLLWEG